MRPLLCFAPALVLGLTAAPAAAQTSSIPGSIELYATFESVGVRLSYSGDSDQDAVAYLEWRPQGGGTWSRGVDMTRITNGRWAGSVLWLSPGAAYEVRATIDDPDGGGATSAAVTTRAEPSTTPSGRTWWIAPGGNDANDGSSGAPLATLQAAAGLANPGDEIRMRPGVYYQTADITRSGSPSSLIHIVADAPGVVLDGSDPAYLSRSDWVDEGGGVFSVPYTGSTRLVAADDTQRLYAHASLADLRSGANGVNQGWAAESARLYVRLEDGSSPSGHVMHVARYDPGILLQGSYWRVAGLEVRFFGIGSGASGIRLRNAHGCVISDNVVHTTGGRPIFLSNGASQNLIERNTCRDPRIDGWPWSAVKGHVEEITAISNRGGRGNVIRNNVVDGLFNGIDARDGGNDENIASDCDYHDNVLTGIGDDAFEIDVVSGINVRCWRNRMDDVYVGFSIAPIYQGPTYVLYNTVADVRRSGFKYSLDSTGEAWICHNTIVAMRPQTSSVHPSGRYWGQHFRNNILTGRNRACVNDDAGESQTGNDFDYDLFDTNDVTLFRWKGANYATMAALRSGTGFEGSGLAADPGFASPPTGDFTLAAGSAAIDAGLRLPGINDVFSGAAPDIGAHERGGPDVTPPAAILDLSDTP